MVWVFGLSWQQSLSSIGSNTLKHVLWHEINLNGWINLWLEMNLSRIDKDITGLFWHCGSRTGKKETSHFFFNPPTTCWVSLVVDSIHSTLHPLHRHPTQILIMYQKAHTSTSFRASAANIPAELPPLGRPVANVRHTGTRYRHLSILETCTLACGYSSRCQQI